MVLYFHSLFIASVQSCIQSIYLSGNANILYQQFLIIIFTNIIIHSGSKEEIRRNDDDHDDDEDEDEEEERDEIIDAIKRKGYHLTNLVIMQQFSLSVFFFL